MTGWQYALLAAAVFAVALAIRLLGRRKRPFRAAWTGMLQGLIALLAVNIAGHFLGVSMPLCVATAGWSAVTGIPGVIALLFVNLLVP